MRHNDRWRGVVRVASRVNRAGNGLWLDLGLYGASAVFALVTAASSMFAPHRAWGAVAMWGYTAATLATVGQLIARRYPGKRTPTGVLARGGLAAGTWVLVALLPLVLQAVQRAAGQPDRAQVEVGVIEESSRLLLHTGTPYLGRASIAALPEAQRLLGYMPYQPGMALFGLPRALDASAAWWSDARVCFVLVSGAALATALRLLWRAGSPPSVLVRALQVAAVLPVSALTLATGGDDLPVLTLCLLAFTLAATQRYGRAGLVVGAAAALKLFAWPVAAVLALHAMTRGRRVALRYGAGALGLPILVAVPTLVVDADALTENVVRFPLGRGLITSPATSPLPGHLLATMVPGGAAIAAALLAATAVVIAARLVRSPPRTVTQACFACGIGLLIAIMLVPATRFGYVLYPLAFLVWGAAARVPAPPLPEQVTVGRSTQ